MVLKFYFPSKKLCELIFSREITVLDGGTAESLTKCGLFYLLPKYLWSEAFLDKAEGLDKLETTPLRVVVFYAYLVFSQPPKCLHQAM